MSILFILCPNHQRSSKNFRNQFNCVRLSHRFFTDRERVISVTQRDFWGKKIRPLLVGKMSRAEELKEGICTGGLFLSRLAFGLEPTRDLGGEIVGATMFPFEKTAIFGISCFVRPLIYLSFLPSRKPMYTQKRDFKIF